MPIKERVVKFLEHLKIGQKKFEIATGLANGFVSSIGEGISTKSVNKIAKTYPELNTNWLLTGEGQMLKGDNKSTSKSNGSPANVSVDMGDQILMMVPLVPQDAVAGYLNGYADPEYLEELTKVPWVVDKEHKGTYMTFTVRNNSMRDGTEAGYKEGDKVLGREIPRDMWRNKLHLNKWTDFVIVHKTDGALLKQIIDHDITKGIITLHSLNSDYKDFTVKLDDLLQLFNVVQVARKK